MAQILKIGTRGSKLALWQAQWAKNALEARSADLSVKLEVIKTKGDKILDVPLAKVGGKGLFVKEIEDALLNGRVDLAVHSMKDMPAVIPDGLCISAVPERETPFDVLISKIGILEQLPPGARIGTSSLRRAAQLLHQRPDLVVIPLRGNLDTRLGKLDGPELDAIVLAGAGVKRMGLEQRISQVLDPDVMLPAVGQGALCIETRANDFAVDRWTNTLNHPLTRSIVMGERAFLSRLEGGCQVPIAAYGTAVDDNFTLTGLVASLDGRKIIKECDSGLLHTAEELGRRLAEKLLLAGAGGILDALKAQPL